jgi:hypothetical protein
MVSGKAFQSLETLLEVPVLPIAILRPVRYLNVKNVPGGRDGGRRLKERGNGSVSG